MKENASKPIKEKIGNVVGKLWLDIITLFWIVMAMVFFRYGENIFYGVIVVIVLLFWCFMPDKELEHGYILERIYLQKNISMDEKSKENAIRLSRSELCY